MGDDIIKKNISKNISKYREASGMSQKELAQKLGVVPSRISNWETGANCPTIDILFEVCEILGVSINDIYGVYPDSKFVLQYDEQEIIKKYRALDSYGKEAVLQLLDIEYKRSQELVTVYAFPESKQYTQKQIDEINQRIHGEQTLNAAHARTDIDIPEGTDTSDNDIMDDENF